MTQRLRLSAVAGLVAVLAMLGSPWPGLVQGQHAQPHPQTFTARLEGYEEVPPISTTATGTFRATLVSEAAFDFELTYSALEGGAVTQAHIHFGQRRVNGGTVNFFCGGGGKPACPPGPATLRGRVTAADITGVPAQGILPGEIVEVIRAMRAGVTYVNVHSTAFPGGEIRGQISLQNHPAT